MLRYSGLKDRSLETTPCDEFQQNFRAFIADAESGIRKTACVKRFQVGYISRAWENNSYGVCRV